MDKILKSSASLILYFTLAYRPKNRDKGFAFVELNSIGVYSHPVFQRSHFRIKLENVSSLSSVLFFIFPVLFFAHILALGNQLKSSCSLTTVHISKLLLVS